MLVQTRHLVRLLILLSSWSMIGCEEAQCPVGTFKIRNICRKEADAAMTIDGVTGDEPEDGGAEISSDAERDQASPEDASTGQPTDAAPLNSSDSVSPAPADSSTPSPECDAVKACGAGNACTNGKCVSTCEETNCAPVTCEALPNPMNGSVAAAGGRAFGQWAEYSCSSGYALSGGNTRRQCQADRTWSGVAPTCVLACQANNDCGPGTACLENADCGSANTCEDNVCLLGMCAGGAITTAAQLTAMRYCKQINGDLSITLSSSGPAQLEFPSVAIVSGNISIGEDATVGSRRTVSFPALTRVGGNLRIGGFSLGPSGSGVVEAHFPRLNRIDLGLLAITAQSLRVLDLSSLTTVGGSVSFQNLDYLQMLSLGALNSVGIEMLVLRVPNVGYSPTFSRLASLFGRPKFGAASVGCCTPSNSTNDCDPADAPSTCW